MATDGQKLTLGDTTITMYVTPGHTLGTISSIIPVKDGGVTHMAAYWGGTAFNWVRGPAAYITPEHPARFWFESYGQSARRFSDLAERAGADVVLSDQHEGPTSQRPSSRSSRSARAGARTRM